MAWFVVAVVGALAVFVIAAAAIGRETHRLAVTPPAPSLDITQAVLWMAERLPGEVTAELSYADVREILTWHLESLDDAGVEQVVGGSEVLVVVEESGTVEALVARARAEAKDYTADQVQAVLRAELDYLRAIGAIGPLAEPGSEAS